MYSDNKIFGSRNRYTVVYRILFLGLLSAVFFSTTSCDLFGPSKITDEEITVTGAVVSSANWQDLSFRYVSENASPGHPPYFYDEKGTIPFDFSSIYSVTGKVFTYSNEEGFINFAEPLNPLTDTGLSVHINTSVWFYGCESYFGVDKVAYRMRYVTPTIPITFN